MSLKSLVNLSYGELGMIKKINHKFIIQSRLVELGILPGLKVRMIKKTPFNGPIQIKIRGYEVFLRHSDAEQIIIH